ncbi:MAG: hypothetical protein GXY23_00260 [Myxococcales bacterium]|nr:hypothetical protein [Myxococcales bacterium]
MPRPLLLCSLLFALAPRADAQAPRPRGEPSAVRGLVGSLVQRVWGGPRVDAPVPSRRPDVPLAFVAPDDAFAVHAPEDVDATILLRAAETLAHARDELRRLGWGEPLADGGRGGTMGFDLYLVPGEAEARGESDGLDTSGTLDAAFAHAVVGLEVDALEPCVVDAYAQATLLGLDPAESPRVRRAFAAWITYRLTGRAGCDDAIDAWQFEPEAGPFEETLLDGAGGALFLELLDARLDGEGRFPRELYQLLRQRTWEGRGLRASPDVWESIEAIVESRGGRFVDLLVDVSVARAMPSHRAPEPVLRALATPPRVIFRGAPRALPWFSRASDRGVSAGGAAYALVDVARFTEGQALSIWLDGEYGVRSSLVVVALDGEGRELARRGSPPGGTLHRAFVPFVVPEGARTLLLVGAGLGFERPDEDVPTPVARRMRFAIDEAKSP